MHLRRLGTALLVAVPLLTGVACASPGSGSPSAAHRAAATSQLADWPTYHRTNDRAGRVLPHSPSGLKAAWSKKLTGAVYGEPLVVGSTMVVATERNYVYGLDARTGAQRWRAQLGTPQPRSGLPCGNIDPLGITGTPAYDSATGSVFVAAETQGGTHTLWALDATTGARRWQRNLDTQTNRNKLAEQQRSALLVTHGRVITTFGGLAGDCGNYVGYATSVATDGSGSTTSYAVPTAREAGMWATSGPVEGANGDVYVASGNGAEVDGTWDGSDSVIELDPVTMRRVAVFAPSTWKDDNRRDLDLGSSSPVPVPAVDRVVIAGKRAVVYLLKPSLGGIGSDLDQVSGCKAFSGAAVTGTTVLLPCRGETKIRALKVGSSKLSWSWTRSSAYGSPVIAGNRVFLANTVSGNLVVLRLSDGAVIGRHKVGNLPHFSSVVVSGDYVFVPSLDGITAFRGTAG